MLRLLPLLQLLLERGTTCETEVIEFYNFLQLACKHTPSLVMKCPFSSETYFLRTTFQGRLKRVTVNGTCSNDPISYQACGLRGYSDFINFRDTIDSFYQEERRTFCGFVCAPKEQNILAPGEIWYIPDSGQYDGRYTNTMNRGSWLKYCDGTPDCNNIGIDEEGCLNDMFTTRTGGEIEASKICDGECDITTYFDYNYCEDEADCNGLTYGMYCDTRYISPMYMRCDQLSCDKEITGVSLCAKENVTTCTRGGLLVPLLNSTRCTSFSDTPMCDNGLDQTNCSDPSRAVLSCEINGYMSTVSRTAVCNKQSRYLPQLCDTGLDKLCVETSMSCLVHKHQLCDGRVDCPDSTDELGAPCLKKTVWTCNRPFSLHTSSINVVNFPLVWVNDGVEDCQGGEDESEEWPTCGSGLTTRYRGMEEMCSEVYLCASGSFVELPSLCDKVETCGNEIRVCQISRNTVSTSYRVVSTEGSVTTPKVVIFPTCLDGLIEIQRFQNSLCRTVPFKLEHYQFLGKTSSTEVAAPGRQLSCDHMYGEAYVYMSCTGQCINSSCPLTKPVQHGSCANQFPGRIYSIRSNSEITFAVRFRDQLYHNDFFVCDNSNCVPFEHVCNLVDNCGDGSDERQCTNNFLCVSQDYLALSQKCDGSIDCPDTSDECNDECGRQIINTIYLKITAAVIGILAMALNSAAVSQSLFGKWESKHVNLVTNKVFIVLIGLGDLLTGVYLVVLSGLDIYYGEKFCVFQVEWLTSKVCSLIGVGSTIGSQISLLSMTALSIIRYRSINSFTAPRNVSCRFWVKMSLICTVILLASVAIAVLPLLPVMEDFFVNGLVYDRHIRLFVGSKSKTAHFNIFQEYFGRMNKKVLKWSVINELVDAMFSRDHGGIRRHPLRFYGNDPVCLFKYFVTNDDPQRLFVWSVLLVNFICIFVITSSYILINLSAVTSANLVADDKSKKCLRKQHRKMQRKIATLITTDLVCWCPFLAICLLHSFEVLDATPMYSYFSIIVLPINSAINPVLYNETISSSLHEAVKTMKSTCEKTLSSVSVIVRRPRHGQDANVETIEMDSIDESKVNKQINQHLITSSHSIS